MLSLLRRVSLVGALCSPALGCSGSSSDTTTLPHPTVVSVSPDEFASPPVCGKAPGSLMRYIATLVDVTQTYSNSGGAGGIGGMASTGGTADVGGTSGAGGSTGGSTDFVLPSSSLQVESAPGVLHYEPVPCLQAVNFGWVVSGHRYRADLLGFDRDDLELLGPGLPVAVDASTRAVVKPRWTSRCANGENFVQAESELTRTARYCEPWVEAAP